jgi:hypothetical protein
MGRFLHCFRNELEIYSSNMDGGSTSLVNCVLVDLSEEVASIILPRIVAQGARIEPLCGVPKNTTPEK